MSFLSDRADLLNGNTSCELITRKFLDIASGNGNNAFIEVFEDEAIDRAVKIDSKVSQGTAGRLAGLVVSVKDLIAIKDHQVTASSRILEGYSSPFHATVIDRLLQEDAIIIGRTNCDEFGMGSSNENSHYGPVTNHLDKSRVAGGSSGGAAVSVQEGSCHLALGTDTGGSVRQPASFTGTFGLKPTYSRLSRYGLLAYASSFDTIGLIGTSPEDIEAVLPILEGPDKLDSTSSHHRIEKPSGSGKIAVIRQWTESEGIQEEVKDLFEQTLEKLKQDGMNIEVVDLPEADHLLETYYILTTAEASSNLSRYDGFRYGMGDEAITTTSLEESYVNTRSRGFGKEVKRRIFLGTFVLSASYYDAYYTKAQKARRIIRERTKEILKDFDLIISPVSPTTAFRLGEKLKDPLTMYLADQFTVHASVCGLPSLSIPSGHDEEGMPIGIQITAGDFEEQKLLAFAKYLGNLA